MRITADTEDFDMINVKEDPRKEGILLELCKGLDTLIIKIRTNTGKQIIKKLLNFEYITKTYISIKEKYHVEPDETSILISSDKNPNIKLNKKIIKDIIELAINEDIITLSELNIDFLDDIDNNYIKGKNRFGEIPFREG